MPYGEEAYIGVGNRAVGHGYTYGDSTRQKFTGYERDEETNLDFAQARMHNYNQGRFTSPDPYKIVAEIRHEKDEVEANLKLRKYLIIVQQWNKYAYAINNPLKYIDPSGEETVLKGTKEQQEKALEILKEILGEERFALITQNSVKGNIVLSIETKNIGKFSKIGDNPENRDLSLGFAGLLQKSKLKTEFLLSEKFTNVHGKKIDLNTETYVGAVTASGVNAKANTIQIYVSPRADKIFNAFSEKREGFRNKEENNQVLTATLGEIVAHEFGHASDRHKQLGPRSMGRATETGDPGWQSFENAMRSRRNSLRRSKH